MGIVGRSVEDKTRTSEKVVQCSMKEKKREWKGCTREVYKKRKRKITENAETETETHDETTTLSSP